MSFKLLVESLLGFIAGDVFAYLRPSDRREFEGFAARLQAGLSKKSLMDCEGLDKYLDSLAVVSQRDVLLKHDSDLKKQIFRELEAAVAVQNSVPELVPEMVSQAFEKADRLFGLVDELDNLVYRWTTLKTEKKNNPQSALELGLLLRAMVEPPKATPPPDDGDFF